MKKLTVGDYAEIKPYLDKANYEGYNSNFITMMMWNHEYHIEYEIHENFLIMLHNYKDLRFWAMPFTTPQYYKEAIEYMIMYSQQNNFDFMIDCAIEEFVDSLRIPFQDQLLFERTDYNDDYIYDRQMHQTLSGKKMQKRRNHFNAFLKEHSDYFYRDLDPVTDFDTILNCLNRWENKKEGLSESMSSEVRGIISLLSLKSFLDFEVGGIFIEGQMEAFIIASKLNHSTIQIHVEKANKEIRGLYPAILKELLEHHFNGEKYINREEDMGLENLKKSKLSLHPMKMIHKYRITLKNTNVRLANDSDLDDIVALWKKSFQDENEESTQYYFENFYKKENTYILQNNDQMISVLQIVPMHFMIQGKSEKCYFILGVCTDSRFEGQGCMKELMMYVLKQYENKHLYLQAYVPEIYYRFHFKTSHLHQVIYIDRNCFNQYEAPIPINDYSLLKTYYNAYTQCFEEYRIRDQKYYDQLIKRCNAFKQQIVLFKDLGYFIYEEDENKIYVSEFIYLNKDAVYNMLAYFNNIHKQIIIECDMKLDLPGERDTCITMLSNYTHTTKIEDRYINEIY